MQISDEKLEEILFREEIRISSFQRRLFAFLIDDFLMTILFFFLFFNSFYALRNNPEAIVDLLKETFFYLVLLRSVYHSLFTALYGASIGKILLKIRIIRVDTLDNPDLLDAVVRTFFKEIGQMFFYVTYFFALGDKFVRTLHDRVVKTIVIMQD